MSSRISLKLNRALEIKLLISLGIFFAIFLPYHQVASHRFVEFDDSMYTYQNGYIIMGLRWESIKWAFTNVFAANWHPLTWISHLVDREMFGPSPGGYLLMNVGWHALASIGCFLAFARVTGSNWKGAAIALIFALHPTNVENVAWASERKSLLNAVFWFWAILAYCRFRDRPSFRIYGSVVIIHLLGLMCKAMSVTLPATLVLIDLARNNSHLIALNRKEFWAYVLRRILEVAPIILASIYFAAVTMSAQAIAMSDLAHFSMPLRITNALVSYWRYIGMFFFPKNLAVFYPLYPTELNIHSAIVPAIGLCAVTLLILFTCQKRLLFIAGWFWFLGTMIPVIGIVQVGSQSHADRYLYIPAIGLSVMIVEAVSLLPRVQWRRWAISVGTAAAVYFGSMMYLTWVQVSYWKDGSTLFAHSLAVTGDCYTNVLSYAFSLLRLDQFDRAAQFAEQKSIVAKNPANRSKLLEIAGIAYSKLQRTDKAIQALEESAKITPPDAHVCLTLAQLYFTAGKPQLAREYLARSEKKMPPSNIENMRDFSLQFEAIDLAIALKKVKTAEARN